MGDERWRVVRVARHGVIASCLVAQAWCVAVASLASLISGWLPRTERRRSSVRARRRHRGGARPDGVELKVLPELSRDVGQADEEGVRQGHATQLDRSRDVRDRGQLAARQARLGGGQAGARAYPPNAWRPFTLPASPALGQRASRLTAIVRLRCFRRSPVARWACPCWIATCCWPSRRRCGSRP